MTREEFQDAMNLIADDLIEEVDALKRKKRRRTQLVRGLSLAACFCLVIGSAFVWGRTKLKVTYDGAMESIQDEGTEYPTNQEQSDELSVGNSGNSFFDSFADSEGNSNDKNKTDFSQVKVIVEELTEDGFVGSVTEAENFAAGTKLMVCVTKGEYVEYTEGSVLEVAYLNKEYLEEDSSVDDKASVESTAEYTIYAEHITLIEGSESE